MLDGMQHGGDGLPRFWEWGERANKFDPHLDVCGHHKYVVNCRGGEAEVADEFAGDFQVVVQLACHSANHVSVAVFLCGVQAGEEPTPNRDEVCQQTLALRFPELVQVYV